MSATTTQETQDTRRLNTLIWMKLAAGVILMAVLILHARNNLSPPPVQTLYPPSFAVSNSGGHIVFRGHGQGGSDLYLMDLTTRQIKPIAVTPEEEGDPEFSPDDKYIVYVARNPSKRGLHVYVSSYVYLRPVAGGVARQITADNYNDHAPSFSPDGTQIIFARDQRYVWGGFAKVGWDQSDLFRINSDGTGLTQITFDKCASIVNPQFTPDGKSIVFSAMRVSGDQPASAWPKDVYAVNNEPFGAPIRKLVTTGGTFYSSLAPNGKHIAVTNGDIRLLPVQEVGIPKVILEGFPCEQVAFNRDGKRLFILTKWGGRGLWRIDVSGENLRQIADAQMFSRPQTD